MAQVANFEHNGITIETNEAPPPIGPLEDNVVAWVVTAPDKDASVPFNVPFQIFNFTDAQKLDTTNSELGTGWVSVYQTLKRVGVTQYVIVVEEGVDDAATTANIIGGIDGVTGQKKGIEALIDCPERPTLIAAPGYSHQKSVIDALAAMAKRLRCRVIADGPGTNKQAAVDLSVSLGGEGLGYERVFIVDPQPEIYSKAALGGVYVPASSVAMGAAAAVKPWESPGNQGVYIDGTSRVVDYNIVDKNTEADFLNSYGIACFCRTSMGGFSLIGNRSVTGKFLSHVGLEDGIARKLEVASQRAMSKNLTKSFMEQEVRKLQLFLDDLAAAEIIMGARVYLHPELNTVERYKNGSWYIVLDYGRYSPNEHMIFHLNSVDSIVEEFLEEVL